MRTCSIAVLTALSAWGVGCAQSRDAVSIEPIVVPGLETNIEWPGRLHAFMAVLKKDAAPETVIRRMHDIISTDSPGLTAYALIQLENWADAFGHEDVLRTIADACLNTPDPLMRWSGIHAAWCAGERRLAENSLYNDYASLAVRPDGPRDKPRGPTRHLGHYSPALGLAVIRSDLVGLVGEWKMTAALPVIEAIAADRKEWLDRTREKARQSLAMLNAAAETTATTVTP